MQNVKEQRISDLEDIVHPMESEAQVARKALAEHSAKTADMEDQLRINNIRLVSFPEGAEDTWKIFWNIG